MAIEDFRTSEQRAEAPSQDELPWAGVESFIERQFPIARLSAESYKERKANYGQTLTGLGKWWGRKPLVLARAAILGLLLPATEDLEQDREVFLKLMTMDAEGLWQRKDKAIAGKRLIEELRKLPPSVQKRFLQSDQGHEPQLRRLDREGRQNLQRLVFERMPYSEKLKYCKRPEQVSGPSEIAWEATNQHLGTNATSLPELVEELGRRRFGHRPRVGDSFCGAGSVPFEAARLGCDAYGSDLSPVAALLTWAALNIVGGGQEVVQQIQEAQREVFAAVDRQVTEWGIEHNEQGWRADAYLYCVEVPCPECRWRVPLAPSWVIGEKTKTIAALLPDEAGRRFAIEIHEGVTDEEMEAAKTAGTVRDSRIWCQNCGQDSPVEVVRRQRVGRDPGARYHESGLRLWENDDLVPLPDDVFQERLYCIRWVESYGGKNAKGQNVDKTRRHYRAPTDQDLGREEKVLELLGQRFKDWQQKGYIPSRRIEPGDKTDEPIRTRGWTHWHHLFTPRQLLKLGFVAKATGRGLFSRHSLVALALALPKCADWNSRLSFWDASGANEKVSHIFHNQALNTHYSSAARALMALQSVFFLPLKPQMRLGQSTVLPLDARSITAEGDLWITDPPYADAINYHELGEFFLAWYEKHLPKLFPDWYTDSKRALAVKADEPIEFRKSMAACYRRLVEHMPDNGLQIVMFTHQDAGVWADLSMILWAAGLRVTAAWCIATETDSSLKQGNYVQGTVLLVCRKRLEAEPVFLDEISHKVEAEVRRQLDEMLALDDASEPNFTDADYQLAAYAAALRVLTERPIEEIDPEREISRIRTRGETGPVEQLIRNAVKIACDHLVPEGIDREIWKTLTAMERFYLKGLEVETHGERRTGVYQELARGFGATDYTDLLASTKANEARLKTAGEFGRRILTGAGFGASLVRQILVALHQIVRTEETVRGLNWLKTEVPDYWTLRDKILHILDFVGRLDRIGGMAHWSADSAAARLLAGAVRNDHV